MRFLLALPATAATSELVDAASGAAQGRYWASVEPFAGDVDAEALAERLVAAGRAWGAVHLLGIYCHERPDEEDRWQPDAELIGRVLRAALQEDPRDAAHGGSIAYEVGELLDRLERLGTERATLARLEFAYEPLLSHQRRAKAIFVELADSPEFFVELVSMQYKAKNEESRDLDERRREAARIAWSILRELRRPPGADDQGQIDAGTRSRTSPS
ncbi:MAG: hypothetical protein ACRDL4_02230 [Thermoleophilaceae bacterium]